jgi:hypothetical protein
MERNKEERERTASLSTASLLSKNNGTNGNGATAEAEDNGELDSLIHDWQRRAKDCGPGKGPRECFGKAVEFRGLEEVRAAVALTPVGESLVEFLKRLQGDGAGDGWDGYPAPPNCKLCGDTGKLRCYAKPKLDDAGKPILDEFGKECPDKDTLRAASFPPDPGDSSYRLWTLVCCCKRNYPRKWVEKIAVVKD